jgi:hypothetical protein
MFVIEGPQVCYSAEVGVGSHCGDANAAARLPSMPRCGERTLAKEAGTTTAHIIPSLLQTDNLAMQKYPHTELHACVMLTALQSV